MPAFAPTDLVLRPGLPYHRTFSYTRDGAPMSWANRRTRLQVVHPWFDLLLIELTAFLEVDEADPTKLHLDLPADFTDKIDQEGRWDLLSVDLSDSQDVLRTPEQPGRVLTLEGVTRAR